MVNVGKWAFIVGIVLAVLAGFFTIPSLAVVLLILGLIVGFLNISEEEVQAYLVATIALLVIGVSGIQTIAAAGYTLPAWVNTVLTNFIVFVASAGLVVAIKAVLQLGKPGK